MAKKKTRFPITDQFRRQSKSMASIGQNADKKIDKHFIGRIDNLNKVKRHIIGWFSLVILLLGIGFFQLYKLNDSYKTLRYVDGGMFSEGIVGSYTNGNPLYATSSVDASVAELVFASLFSYDENNKLVPDMAESINVSEDDKSYTVRLKENLFWHDGRPLTAEDVAFTYKTTQNPNVDSYQLPGWSGIAIDRIDERTVKFTLETVLGSFPHSLTTGIIPKHILEGVPPEQLRTNDFNTLGLIGSGPFKLDNVEVSGGENINNTQIGLSAFEQYHEKAPSLKKYTIKTYQNQEELKEAYISRNITAAADVSLTFNDLKSDEKNQYINLDLAAQTDVFFKTSSGVLVDSKVRRALVQAVDKKSLIDAIGQEVIPVNSPFLKNHFAYDKKQVQATGNREKAKKILDESGWKSVGPGKPRQKTSEDKKVTELKFNLFTSNNPEHITLGKELDKQWAQIGVEIDLIQQTAEERKTTIATHNYDAIINSISIGGDPDVFAFWHSSQASEQSDSRLNFSEYKSEAVDQSLEAGRSRNDPTIRKAKYQPFIKKWLEDNPALLLYQPQYTFLVRGPISGVESGSIVAPANRYKNVEDWQIKRKKLAL